jgi:hypothetical protein
MKRNVWENAIVPTPVPIGKTICVYQRSISDTASLLLHGSDNGWFYACRFHLSIPGKDERRYTRMPKVVVSLFLPLPCGLVLAPGTPVYFRSLLLSCAGFAQGSTCVGRFRYLRIPSSDEFISEKNGSGSIKKFTLTTCLLHTTHAQTADTKSVNP